MCACVCSVVISNSMSSLPTFVSFLMYPPEDKCSRHYNLCSLFFLSVTQVQAEIKKKWQKWKLGTTDLDDLRNTGSPTLKVESAE